MYFPSLEKKGFDIWLTPILKMISGILKKATDEKDVHRSDSLLKKKQNLTLFSGTVTQTKLTTYMETFKKKKST